MGGRKDNEVTETIRIPTRAKVVDNAGWPEVVVEAGQPDMCSRWYLSVDDARSLARAINQALDDYQTGEATDNFGTEGVAAA